MTAFARYREKLLNGGLASVAFFGDSWVNNGRITAPFAASMTALHGNGGMGAFGVAQFAPANAKVAQFGDGDFFAQAGAGTTDWTSFDATGAEHWGLTASHKVSVDANSSMYLDGYMTVFKLFYVIQPGGGTFDLIVDGVVNTTINTDGVLSASVVTLNLPYAQHAVKLQVTAQDAAGVAVTDMYHQCADTGVIVHKLGNSGTKVSDFLNINETMWGTLVTEIDPDVAILLFGTNEHNFNVPPQSFEADTIALIDRIRAASPDCEILLLAAGDNGLSNQDFSIGDYVQAWKKVASDDCNREASRPDINFASCLGIIRSYMENTGLYEDNAHLNAIGGEEVARWLLNNKFKINRATVPTPWVDHNGYESLADTPYFGLIWNYDGLDNEHIGGPFDLVQAIAFRAEHSVPITGVQWHKKWSNTIAGYSDGDGGHIRVSLHPEQSGSPTPDLGVILAQYEYPDPYDGVFFPIAPFDPPVPVVAGTKYHIVFENIHANPDANYISINCSWNGVNMIGTNGSNEKSRHYPVLPISEYAYLGKFGASAWERRLGGRWPNHEIQYADGNTQGFAYIHGFTNQPYLASGNLKVRQVITPARTVTVKDVNIRIGGAGHAAGTHGGPPRATLYRASFNRSVQMDQVNFDENDVVTGYAIRPSGGGVDAAPVVQDYIQANWTQNHTLYAGQKYYLQFDAPAATNPYYFQTMQNGRIYNYNRRSYNGEGFAQVVNPNTMEWGGWLNFNQVDYNREDTDLQFYMLLA